MDPKNQDTRALAKDAVRSATDLVSAELSHAKEELKHDAAEAASGAIVLAAAGIGAFFGLELLVLGMAGAVRHPMRSAAFGLGLLSLSAIAAGVGVQALPKKPLGRTTARLASDAEAIRDQLT
jgi:hypothetical protein